MNGHFFLLCAATFLVSTHVNRFIRYTSLLSIERDHHSTTTDLLVFWWWSMLLPFQCTELMMVHARWEVFILWSLSINNQGKGPHLYIHKLTTDEALFKSHSKVGSLWWLYSVYCALNLFNSFVYTVCETPTPHCYSSLSIKGGIKWWSFNCTAPDVLQSVCNLSTIFSQTRSLSCQIGQALQKTNEHLIRFDQNT